MEVLAQRVLKGDHLSIAKLITLVENRSLEGREIMKQLYRHTGKAHVVGITGPIGVGKSSMINSLLTEISNDKKTIGVIAIDPSSPLSGGSLLGDRVRMSKHSTNRKIFIRSMATRGSFGGLALAAMDVIDILDAAGMEIIFVETIGAGQTDVDIMKVADTIVVVTIPQIGDYIQTMKAGLMEIGSILVVNKADLQGADEALYQINGTLKRDYQDINSWSPPVIKTVATTGEGIRDLSKAIQKHWDSFEGTELHKQKRIERNQVKILVAFRDILFEYETKIKENGTLEEISQKLLIDKTDYYSIAYKILSKYLKA
jgi:LAO/AO transport system kinase